MVNFLDRTSVTISVSIVTLWALFGDDIRILIAGKTGDPAFYILVLICFAIFSVEIILSCYAKSDYIFSFFFWLDLISTVSLLLDVGWISDMLFGTSTDSITTQNQNSAQAAKAANASKVGSKTARIIRIIRLIRLIRIVKLYKAAEKERQRKTTEDKQKKKAMRKALNAGQMSSKNHPIE